MAKASFLQIGIGIDISKDDFKVCIKGSLATKRRKIKASSKFSNHVSGFAKFWQWQAKHLKDIEAPVEYLMEATGVYHESLAWFLYEQGARVVVVLANRARLFLQSEGLDSKTDKIDAQGLAQMSLAKDLRPWQPISGVLRDLKTQTRYYASLQEDLSRSRNRLHALRHSYQASALVMGALKKQIRFLEKQIQSLRASIQKTLEADPELARKLVYLYSIKGVGLLTAAVVLAETGGFALFHSQKQLVSYAGYDVIEHQSGKYRGKTHISKKGNKYIRRILFLPAFSALKPQGSFQDLYQRVSERTQMKMKGQVAVQRKLLCLMYTLWKKEEMFDPQKGIKKVEEPEPSYTR